MSEELPEPEPSPYRTVAPGVQELDRPAAPPGPPPSVTMRQARQALLAAGLLDSVEAAIDALPSPAREAARIEWEYSGTVERGRPLIAALAPALGMDDAGLDALFVAAGAIP